MKKYKNIYFYVIAIALILVVTAVGFEFKKHQNKVKAIQSTPTKQKDTNLNIMTTNRMLYYMVKGIVKDKNIVDFMFIDEESQWNYVCSEDNFSNVNEKDLFLYSGAGFEPWINTYINKLSKAKVSIINVSRGIKIIDYNHQIKYEDIIIKENPYYWMNLDNYKTALFNITSAIQDKDPKNRGFYEDNFKQALLQLDDYSKQFKDIFQKFKDVTFIVQGDKLDYFLKYNNFKYIKIYKDSDVKEIKDIKGTKEKTQDTIEDKTQDKIIQEKRTQEKIDKTENFIFMYSDDNELNENAELIKKYNMKTIKITLYDFNLKYNDVIENNIKSLNDYILP